MSEQEHVETSEAVVEEKSSWWTLSTNWASQYQFAWGAAVGIVAGIAVGGWTACVFRPRK